MFLAVLFLKFVKFISFYNRSKLMESCLQYIFFCCDFEEPRTPSRHVTPRKSRVKRSAIQTRLKTAFKKEDFVIIIDE